jgi:antitoxin component YwqK of YwqJK toxin-antitoxin module
MKKILLIILSLIIFSCSSNNEPENGIVLTYHNSWPIFLSEYLKAPIKEKITYKNGVRDGEYISYFDDGEIKEKGRYKNDLKDGEFIFWLKKESAGEWRSLEKKVTYKNGVRDGEYISYIKYDKIKEKGSYKNGVRDGEYISYFDNGKIEEKSIYKNDLRHGMTIIYNYRGCLKEKSFYSNGKKNGKSFVYPYPCEKDYIEYISTMTSSSDSGHKYKNNIPEKTYGLIQVYTFKDGEEEGEFLSYYEKGVLESIGNYKNGKVDGYFIKYNTGNQLVKLKSDLIDSPNYKACEKIEYYRKVYGFPSKIRCDMYGNDYSSRMKAREKIYSMIKEEIIKNPLIASESNWANGLQNGPYTDYHFTTSNEQIIDGKGNTINGMPFGPYQSYYDNGQLRYDGVFNEDGHLVYGKSFYKNGKLKEEFLEEDLEERIAAKQRKNSSSSSSSSYRCPSGKEYYSRSEVYSWYSSQYPSFGIVVTDWGDSWNVSVNSNSGVYKSIPVPKCQ